MEGQGKQENPEKLTIQEMANMVLRDPTIPRVYVNGFFAGNSNADVYVILQQNGHPVTVLNMSFTCAKTLQQTLGNVIARVEVATDHKIMLMSEISSKNNMDKQ